MWDLKNPSSGWGESNTGSNVWTAWVWIFKQKVWVDLEFKKVNAWSSKVTVTDDWANNEVDIDIDSSQIATSTLNNDAWFVDDWGLVWTKSVNETAIANDKIIVYKTAWDEFVYEDKPTSWGGSKTMIRWYSSVDQSINAWAIAGINFGALEFDALWEFNTSTSVFTATSAWKYQVYAKAYNQNGFSWWFQMLIDVNGAPNFWWQALNMNLGSVNYDPQISQLVNLGIWDTVSFRFTNLGTSSVNLDWWRTDFTNFYIYKVD